MSATLPACGKFVEHSRRCLTPRRSSLYNIVHDDRIMPDRLFGKRFHALTNQGAVLIFQPFKKSGVRAERTKNPSGGTHG
jgi:hypothetical protein